VNRTDPIDFLGTLERAEAALDAEWQPPPCDSRPPRVRRAARKPAAPVQTIIDAPGMPVAPGQLGTREDQLRYIMAGRVDAAGNAHGGRFTLVSRASGSRFTYRVKPPTAGKAGAPCRKCGGSGCWQGRRNYPCFTCKGTGVNEGAAGAGERLFVSVLTGSDNVSDYTYLGQILRQPQPRYEHGRKSRIGDGAPSAKAAQWFLSRLFGGGDTSDVEVWHDGSCGRCGRDLTDPLSVSRGIGPECWEKMHGG
jgi:hypothetical protein